MSDYTSALDLIAESSLSKEVTANELFDAASPASIFARRRATSVGLSWGVIGGRFGATSIGNQVVTLTASAVNYVVIDRATLVASVSTGTTNWNDTDDFGRDYKITTDTSTATGWEDHRAASGGILEPGGGAGVGTTSPGGADTNIQYNDGGAFAGDARLAFNETTKVTTGQFAVDGNAVNVQTGTTYTLQASDNGKVVTLSNASAITVTVPSGLGVGFSVICIQLGAGQVSFSASGTTINPSGTLKLTGQHAAASLIAYATNTFNLAGNITA